MTGKFPANEELEKYEQMAQKYLFEPYFAKTITPKNWLLTLDTLTEGPKPETLRIGDHRYRIRRSTSGNYEIQDCKDESNSLFKKEKDQLLQLGRERKLPPHQSFTYYEPRDGAFRVFAYEDMDRSVGVRVLASNCLVNCIGVHDILSTTRRYNGFNSYSAAVRQLSKHSKTFAKSFDELKSRTKWSYFNQIPYYYNESLVRASWCCDGSSHILIYIDEVDSRLTAIVRKITLEQRLKSNQELYKQKPYNYKPGYEAPISFWAKPESNSLLKKVFEIYFYQIVGRGFSNHNMALLIYSKEQQRRDVNAYLDFLVIMASENNISKYTLYKYLVKNYEQDSYDLFVKLLLPEIKSNILDCLNIVLLLIILRVLFNDAPLFNKSKSNAVCCTDKFKRIKPKIVQGLSQVQNWTNQQGIFNILRSKYTGLRQEMNHKLKPPYTRDLKSSISTFRRVIK